MAFLPLQHQPNRKFATVSVYIGVTHTQWVETKLKRNFSNQIERNDRKSDVFCVTILNMPLLHDVVITIVRIPQKHCATLIIELKSLWIEFPPPKVSIAFSPAWTETRVNVCQISTLHRIVCHDCVQQLHIISGISTDLWTFESRFEFQICALYLTNTVVSLPLCFFSASYLSTFRFIVCSKFADNNRCIQKLSGHREGKRKAHTTLRLNSMLAIHFTL